MEITNYQSLKINHILYDRILCLSDQDVDAIVNFSLKRLVDLLNDDRIFSDLEREVLVLVAENQSYRKIAAKVNLSHTKVANVDRDVRRKLRSLKYTFISNEIEFQDVNDHLLSVLTIDEYLKIEASTFDQAYRKWCHGSQMLFSSNVSEETREHLMRKIGMKEVLSRDFIETVKRHVADEFGVEKIELVGSYRRGEAKERSDVDFLILDETAPRGMKYLEMSSRLQNLLGKEVGLMHANSMTRSTDEPILQSMMKEIEDYD